MNKYSSKAVKTAATVGMSLAMVLSNAAPVFAAYTDQTITTTTSAENFIAKFNDALTDAGLSLETLQVDDEIALAGEDNLKVLTFDNTANGFVVNPAFLADIEEAANLVTYKGDSYNTADYVIGLADALNTMIEIASGGDASLVKQITDLLGNVADYKDDMLTISGYTKALKLKEKVEKYEKYEGNLPEDAVSGETVNHYSTKEYTDAKADLLDAVDNFQADNYGETLDTYLTQLEKVYNKFVEVEGEKGITKAKVDAIVKKIKNGTLGASYEGVTSSALTKENYDVFKEDDAVIDLMDMFTESYDSLEDINDALDAKNEYAVALKKDKAKYDGKTKETLETYLNKNNFDDIVAKMTDEMFTIVKDYKENVLDVLMTLDSKKVGSTFVEKSEKSAYVSASKLKDMINAMGSKDYVAGNSGDNITNWGIFAISDKKEGTRYYDDLAAHMEEVAKALKAVTTDIAKLTPVNIKASDKATLEAAEDAIFELTSLKGDYVGNLTSSQEKEVRAAQTKIENLREAFDNLGVTNAAGWYSMGNGDWGYNNEDGTPAAYKWVASGADWYMIKDGKMLRNTWLATDGGRWYYLDNAGKMVTNQSVDGCWINSYGVYMSPSYNG